MTLLLVRWIYNLLFPFVFLAMLPGFLRRMVRRGNYRRHFGQRLGLYSPEVRARLAEGPPRPWLQAVSVGEMLVALKLIAALRERRPDLRLVLSTTTTTGLALAEERAGPGVEVVYTPVDALPAVRRAFAALRPSQVIIVDGGLWPNLLAEARWRGVPTALVNARLSPRSERRFRRFRPLAAALFGRLDLVAVPEASDAARWRTLGVPAGRLRHTGSVKFDDAAAPASGPAAGAAGGRALRDCLRALGVADSAPVLLAGSTHPGEERIVAECFLNLRRRFPNLFLIVAPRHVERADSLRAELGALGLRLASRTAPAAPAAVSPPDALLLDTTGELRAWYALATVVFIGKSLAGEGGGQNPAEAIAAGKPVVFGPHMENFGDLTEQLLAADAAVQVPDAAGLAAQCGRLLADAAARAALAARGRRLLEVHRGAAGRTADLLLAPEGFSACQGKDSPLR